MDVDSLLQRFPWRQIRNCPGRYSLAMEQYCGTPGGLAPGHVVREFEAAAARDPVAVVEFDAGGLISYRRSDGRYLHTLNTREGFRRKLRDLGIDLGD